MHDFQTHIHFSRELGQQYMLSCIAVIRTVYHLGRFIEILAVSSLRQQMGQHRSIIPFAFDEKENQLMVMSEGSLAPITGSNWQARVGGSLK